MGSDFNRVDMFAAVAMNQLMMDVKKPPAGVNEDNYFRNEYRLLAHRAYLVAREMDDVRASFQENGL